MKTRLLIGLFCLALASCTFAQDRPDSPKPKASQMSKADRDAYAKFLLFTPTLVHVELGINTARTY
jgi:hypothetical protein